MVGSASGNVGSICAAVVFLGFFALWGYGCHLVTERDRLEAETKQKCIEARGVWENSWGRNDGNCVFPPPPPTKESE